LNLLGTREPEVYGRQTLDEIDGALRERAAARGARIESFQSNVEGLLIDHVQAARGRADGIVINPGGYTHTSVAIADAIRAVGLPAVEVHLSNLAQREEFRVRSLTAQACVGTVSGFGARSYYLALDAILDVIEDRRRALSKAGR
jgi:3-dehydroquinate dehydratase-2